MTSMLRDLFGACVCEPPGRWLDGYAQNMSLHGTGATTVAWVNRAWAYRLRCHRRRCRNVGPLTEDLIAAHVALTLEQQL